MLDLLFTDGKPKKKGELPSHPIAKIYLATYSRDEEGRCFLTPTCASAVELDCQIDFLKDELEGIRRRARKRFARLTASN